MIYFSPSPVAQKQDLLKVLSERITGVDLKGACPVWALFACHLRHIICAARGTTQHLRVVRRGGVGRVARGVPGIWDSQNLRAPPAYAQMMLK